MCLPVFIFYLWLNLEYHCLSPFTHYAVNILVCWCFSEDRNPWKTLGSCQLLQQAVGGVFLCTWKLRPAGHRVFLATHTTKRSHRPREPLPGQLALSWWQRRLSRNQSEPCLPAAPFHRFMDACVRAWWKKPVPARPEFALICMRLCAHVHEAPCRRFSRFNLPTDYKWKSRGSVSHHHQSMKTGGGREHVVSSQLMMLIKFWLINSFCYGWRANVIIKPARLLRMPISQATVSSQIKLSIIRNNQSFKREWL